MKLENLEVGAIIMHADANKNPIHTGTVYIVLKIDKERKDIEACVLNSQFGISIGEVRHIPTCTISEYNMLTQIVIASPTDRAPSPKKDLYLRWAFGKKTSLGKVGDKTPYKLENGRNLFVGDIVKISKAGEEHCGCTVVHDRTYGYVIMGIAASCNDRTANINDWNVSLESAFYNRHKGNITDAGYGNFDIEVVDFPPEEKE